MCRKRRTYIKLTKPATLGEIVKVVMDEEAEACDEREDRRGENTMRY